MPVHPVVKPAPLGVTGIKFGVLQFARIRAPPGLGGETEQHAWPTAVRVFKTIRMQAGKELRDGTPGQV